MAEHTVPYTQCNYSSRTGLYNKRCLGVRCNLHRNKKLLIPSKNNCGNGTKSTTGLCANKSTCGWGQNSEPHKMRKYPNKTFKEFKELSRCDMMKYISHHITS